VTNQYNSWHHNCKIDGQRRRSGRPALHDRVDLAEVYEFPPGFARLFRHNCKINLIMEPRGRWERDLRAGPAGRRG
jgi:hypothetical protein